MSSIWEVPGTIDRLRELHENKKSCSEMAAAISSEFSFPISRNSIIGKLHRLGLPGNRPNFSTGGAPQKRSPRPRKRMMIVRANSAGALRVITTIDAPHLVPRIADVVPLHVSLDDLTHGSCRYAYGDGPFTFCGCASMPGRPYCEPHAALCFTPNAGERRGDTEARKRAYLRSQRAA